MITKKNAVLFLSIFFAASVHNTVMSINIMNSLRWLKQKFASHPVTRGVAADDLEMVVAAPVDRVEHLKRLVVFENNIPQLSERLKDDPESANVPNLIDQSVIVNGNAIAPGTSSEVIVEDNKVVITIKFYKGFAKLIYAMPQGALRGILMKLLKQIDPWIQWQYSVVVNIGQDLEVVQLADLILLACQKLRDENTVNHRFKWILVVDLSLNETVDL